MKTLLPTSHLSHKALPRQTSTPRLRRLQCSDEEQLSTFLTGLSGLQSPTGFHNLMRKMGSGAAGRGRGEAEFSKMKLEKDL